MPPFLFSMRYILLIRTEVIVWLWQTKQIFFYHPKDSFSTCKLTNQLKWPSQAGSRVGWTKGGHMCVCGSPFVRFSEWVCLPMRGHACVLLRHADINYVSLPVLILPPICLRVRSCGYTQPNKLHISLWTHLYAKSHSSLGGCPAENHSVQLEASAVATLSLSMCEKKLH